MAKFFAIFFCITVPLYYWFCIPNYWYYFKLLFFCTASSTLLDRCHFVAGPNREEGPVFTRWVIYSLIFFTHKKIRTTCLYCTIFLKTYNTVFFFCVFKSYGSRKKDENGFFNDHDTLNREIALFRRDASPPQLSRPKLPSPFSS